MSTKAPAQARLSFVDTLRGLAVVFMVPLHASHGWLRPELRSGTGWSIVQFFGGLAAPIFLTLAGVSLGLRWAVKAQKQGVPAHRVDLGRALSMIVLGYLLRLQMWVVDGAGYARPESYPGELLLLGGYLLAYVGFGQLASAPRKCFTYCGIAALMVAAGFANVAATAPARLYGLARVDVLQCIGASLALVIAAGAARGPAFSRPALYVALGVAAAFIASWTRAWVPGPLPEAAAAYLGQWPAEPGRPLMGLFPIFPWLAYAFIGVAVGLHWGAARSEHDNQTLVLIYTALGACLALATNESLPHVFRALHLWPWMEQPVRVAYRVGLVLTLSGAALALSSPRSLLRSTLDVLGRASLLIYWIHLEFTFGAASSAFTRKLDFSQFLIGTTLVLAAMLLLAHVRLSSSSIRPRVRGAAPH